MLSNKKRIIKTPGKSGDAPPPAPEGHKSPLVEESDSESGSSLSSSSSSRIEKRLDEIEKNLMKKFEALFSKTEAMTKIAPSEFSNRQNSGAIPPPNFDQSAPSLVGPAVSAISPQLLFQAPFTQKIPSLHSLEVHELKRFRKEVEQFNQVNPHQLNIKLIQLIAPTVVEMIVIQNGYTYEELLKCSDAEIWDLLAIFHHSPTLVYSRNQLKKVVMKSTGNLRLNLFQYAEEYKFQIYLLGSEHIVKDKLLVKIFCEGLFPNELREELLVLQLDKLEEAIKEADAFLQVYLIFPHKSTGGSQAIGHQRPGQVRNRSWVHRGYPSKSSVHSSNPSRPSPTPPTGVTGVPSTPPTTAVPTTATSVFQRQGSSHPRPFHRPFGNGYQRPFNPNGPVTRPPPTSTPTIRVSLSDLEDQTFIRYPTRILNDSKDHEVLALVDTGSNTNVVRRSVINMLNLQSQIQQGASTNIRLAGGAALPYSGEYIELDLMVNVDGNIKSVEDKFYIFDQGDELLFGVNLFRQLTTIPGEEPRIQQIVAEPEEEEDIWEGPELVPSVTKNKEIKVDPEFPLMDQLNQLLQKHQDRFGDLDTVGMKVPPMSFEVTNVEQIKSQPSRFIHPSVLQLVKTDIDKLVEQGVLKKVHHAKCASPLVIVKKPDGKLRLAVDFRILNQHIVPVPHQLPFQAALFNGLSNKGFYAKLDNSQGYYQALLDPKVMEYCCITSPWGIFQFQRVPFGISIAPGWYQDVMAHIVLDDLHLTKCVVYIDDTIVFGSTAEEFLSNLESVLERFTQYNVKIKPSKCEFGSKEILFLGHLFNKDGYRLCEERMKALRELPTPKTLKDLRSIIGMFNFFRPFIPNLSQYLAPLQEKTKGRKKGAIEWSDSDEEALKSAKESLNIAHTLVFLNDEDPIILYTDSSDIGMGSVLIQVQSNIEKPVMFLSKKFTAAEAKWTIVERECYCIVWSLKQLQQHLLGRRFVIKTDNRNISFLHNSTVPRIIRWRLQLSEFQFVVEHIEGKLNVVADALSRVMRMVVTTDYEEFIVNDDNKIQFLQSIHNDIIGHHGIQKTLDSLEDAGISWDGMTQDVTTYIHECLLCQKLKPNTNQVSSNVPHHLHGKAPMESLSVDTIGPLPADNDGNKYILVIVDNFSKFVELFPCPDTSSMEYVCGLIQHIGIFGMCKSIRTDGGSQFTSIVCMELAKLLGIKHLVIVPYHPQSNGMVERRNKEVMKHLRALVYTKRVKTSWSKYLPLVQRIINYTLDSSLGVAPAAIIFGNMLDTNITMNMQQDHNGKLVSTFLNELMATQLELIKSSQDHLEAESKRRDKYFPKIQQGSYVPGEYVVIEYPSRPTDKLTTLYRGPLMVVDHIHDDIYRLLDLISNKQHQVHSSRIHKLILNKDVTKDQMLELAGLDPDEYLVESIVDHRKSGRKKKDYEFLVHWKGFSIDDRTWEPYSNLQHLSLLDHYLTDHPEIKI